MKRFTDLSVWRLVAVALFALAVSLPMVASDGQVAIAIHGGAGTMKKENMTPEREKAYHDALQKALAAGYAILEKGGTALEAVEATIMIMEDDPLFNAGKGAVFTQAGTNELDASIMNGADLNAGAVAGVKTIKNPIQLARLVMTDSPHVLMAGDGAEAFADTVDVEKVDPKYFYTEERWQALERVRESIKKKQEAEGDSKRGTVGCVALDKHGNIAAGTSTGGMTYKKFGRVGDSPIVGAGTYAENASCAVSATGHGEYFIRAAVAYDIAARVKYQNLSVQEAADAVIHQKLGDMGGDGGVIVLDAKGNIAFSFNTAGMYRGWMKGGKSETAIYKDE